MYLLPNYPSVTLLGSVDEAFPMLSNQVKRYFEYEDPNGTVKEIWRQVSQKLPLIKLMSNRDKRVVLRDLTEPDCSCVCSNQSGVHTTL